MGGGFGEMVGIPGTQVFTNQPPPPYSDAFTQAKAFIGLWPCLVMAEYPIYNHRRTTVRITSPPPPPCPRTSNV